MVADPVVGIASDHATPLPGLERAALVACELVGAVGGPLSYYAGSQLAGVSFGYGTVPTVIGLALLWGMIFPLLHWVARQLAH